MMDSPKPPLDAPEMPAASKGEAASSGSSPEKAGTPKASSFTLRDVLQILGVALVIALVLRACVLEGFRIPSESMEQSLVKGDFVLVSKLHYGPRLPITVGVPLTNWYIEGVRLPYLRLPGFTAIQRGDPIVFNYPVEEEPVDRRLHYIKRVAGLPGDSVALRDKQLYVNGVHTPLGQTMQQGWKVTLESDTAFSVDSLRAMGASEINVRARSRITFTGTEALAASVATWDGVVSVEANVQAKDPGFGMRIFPIGSAFGRDHYGPLYVPAQGDTLTLSSSNWLTYQDLIRKYEGHQVRVLANGAFEIDSVRTNQYVVEQDYYFVLGDNRDSSVDSRVWGFVPVDHVVGKAVSIYFSWDAERRRVRTERLFNGIP